MKIFRHDRMKVTIPLSAILRHMVHLEASATSQRMRKVSNRQVKVPILFLKFNSTLNDIQITEKGII